MFLVLSQKHVGIKISVMFSTRMFLWNYPSTFRILSLMSLQPIVVFEIFCKFVSHQLVEVAVWWYLNVAISRICHVSWGFITFLLQLRFCLPTSQNSAYKLHHLHILLFTDRDWSSKRKIDFYKYLKMLIINKTKKDNLVKKYPYIISVKVWRHCCRLLQKVNVFRLVANLV